MTVSAARTRARVTAFCPRCHEDDPWRPLEEVERLDGRLIESAGRVVLVRSCETHGRVESLYEEDAEILTWLERWRAPTKPPTPDSPDDLAPVPGCYRGGLGGRQIQHTCILVEDINRDCNLRCPACYAAAGPGTSGMATADEVLKSIDRRLDLEGGRLDVVMLSGGEPTLHPELPEILEAVAQRNIVRIMVNTNGLTLARDDALLDLIAKHNRRIEVYLQFDGFKESTYRTLRGADLSEAKQRTVRRLTQAGVFTTLVMTAAAGINDDEIGAVLRFVLRTPYLGGLAIQPVFGAGRSPAIDPGNRLTCTGVLRRLEEQTSSLVRWNDLTALPCSHPHCSSVGYLFRFPGGRWRSLVALVGEDRLLEHIGLVANRVVDADLGADLRRLAESPFAVLLSERNTLTHPDVAEILVETLQHGDPASRRLLRLVAAATGRRDRLRRLLAKRVKRITIKPFMDIHTMVEERLLQCCVHTGTVAGPRHQAVPFCAAQTWPLLAEAKLGAISRDSAGPRPGPSR